MGIPGLYVAGNRTAFTASERRAVSSLAGLYAIRMFGLFMVLPVLALFSTELAGTTPLLVGLALGAYGLAQALFQIPFGVWSDHYGRKRMMVIGLALFALGSLVAGLSEHIYGVILGRLLQGGGAIAATVMALASELTRDATRSKAMALIGASIGVSFALSLLVGPVISHALGLSGLFLVTTGLGLLGIVVTLWLVPDPPPDVHAPPLDPSRVMLARVLGDGQLRRLNLGIFSLHFMLTASFVVVPVVLRDHLGLPPGRHWEVYLPVLLGSFVMMMPLMMAGERRGKQKPVFLLSVLLLGIAQLALAHWQFSTVGVVVALFGFFFAFNLLEASLPSLVSKLCPAGARGTAMGVYSTSQFLGAFFGGALGGLVAQHVGSGGVFLLCAGMALIWWLGALGMRSDLGRVTPDPGSIVEAG